FGRRQLLDLLVEFGEESRTRWAAARVRAFDRGYCTSIDFLRPRHDPPGILAPLASDHVEQDLPDLLEDRADEAVDRGRLSGLERFDQANPRLVHNALEFMTAAEVGEVLPEDGGADPQYLLVGAPQELPPGSRVATAQPLEQMLKVGRSVIGHVDGALGRNVR